MPSILLCFILILSFAFGVDGISYFMRLFFDDFLFTLMNVDKFKDENVFFYLFYRFLWL